MPCQLSALKFKVRQEEQTRTAFESPLRGRGSGTPHKIRMKLTAVEVSRTGFQRTLSLLPGGPEAGGPFNQMLAAAAADFAAGSSFALFVQISKGVSTS